MSKVTFEHIGTTHTNLQTPPGVRSKVVRNGVRIGETRISRGFSDQNSVKLTPWVESRGRSDRSALPSHYHSSRTARDPAGTALGREIRGNCQLGISRGGAPGFGTSLGLAHGDSHGLWGVWGQTKWWKSIPWRVSTWVCMYLSQAFTLC